MKSRKATLQVLTALREFTRSINTFKTEINRNIDEANDTEREDYTGCQTKSDSNAHSEKDLMKADGTNVRNFWREELELMEKSIVQQSKDHPDNKYYNPEFMDYLSIYMLLSIGMWSNILSGNFQKFNVAYRSFEISKIFSTNGHVERYFGMLKNKREKLPWDNFLSQRWNRQLG